MNDMEDSDTWQESDDSEEESEEEESDDDDAGAPDKAKDEQEDPFDEDDEQLENPLQATSAEDDAVPSTNTPLHEKKLYIEVVLTSYQPFTKLNGNLIPVCLLKDQYAVMRG